MAKESREVLTNQELGSRFANPFDLVNYAIGIARHRIHSGREICHHPGIYNQAYDLILDIKEGRDLIEALEMSDEEEEDETPLSYETPKDREQRGETVEV